MSKTRKKRLTEIRNKIERLQEEYDLENGISLLQIYQTRNPMLIRGRDLADEISFKLCRTKNYIDYVWLFNKIIDYQNQEFDIHVEYISNNPIESKGGL